MAGLELGPSDVGGPAARAVSNTRVHAVHVAVRGHVVVLVVVKQRHWCVLVFGEA